MAPTPLTALLLPNSPSAHGPTKKPQHSLAHIHPLPEFPAPHPFTCLNASMPRACFALETCLYFTLLNTQLYAVWWYWLQIHEV